MRIEQTSIKDCFIVHDTVFGDSRGFFFESFNRKVFLEQTGLDVNFVQDNQSGSQRGVLRGLHFQYGEYSQAKLVRVLRGKVLDVAVDLRQSSRTFGQHVVLELSESSHTQLFIPRGFAHGFVVLSEFAEFFYKCDNYYNKASDRGVIFNDPDLGIDWQISENELILSEKDTRLPGLKDIIDTLNF
jgi:dTDP-4-dehydrorhamnose 3,5-epimerase